MKRGPSCESKKNSKKRRIDSRNPEDISFDQYFPSELLWNIFSFLPEKDLKSLNCVSQNITANTSSFVERRINEFHKATPFHLYHDLNLSLEDNITFSYLKGIQRLKDEINYLLKKRKKQEAN